MLASYPGVGIADTVYVKSTVEPAAKDVGVAEKSRVASTDCACAAQTQPKKNPNASAVTLMIEVMPDGPFLF